MILTYSLTLSQAGQLWLRPLDQLHATPRDAWVAPGVAGDAAYAYVFAGEYDAAIEQFEVVLSLCSRSVISVPLLRIDPRLDPVRNHPRFQALLEREE